jgi:asparagine synthetase B (glutamine-hydrolysing)
MTMAASIESRVPFLDHELAGFVSSLPDDWRVKGFRTKRILRAAPHAHPRSHPRPAQGRASACR